MSGHAHVRAKQARFPFITLNLGDNFSYRWQKVLELAEMAKLAVLGCFEKKDPFLVSSILSRSDLSSS